MLLNVTSMKFMLRSISQSFSFAVCVCFLEFNNLDLELFRVLYRNKTHRMNLYLQRGFKSALKAVVHLVQQWLSTNGKSKNTIVVQSTSLGVTES